MPLSLVRRPPPAEPPEPLSPARQALAANFAEYQQQLAHLDVLDAPQRRHAAAVERLAIAQAAVDAIAELENAALAAWTSNPAGALPEPLTEKRAIALSELASASAEHDAAAKTWNAIEPSWRAEEIKLHDISRARPALATAVCIEIARDFAERRRQAFYELSRCGGILEAMLAAVRKVGDDAAQCEVLAIMRNGGRLDDTAFHDGAIRYGQRFRDTAAGLHSRLMVDFTAEVVLDEPDAGGAAA